MRVSLRLRLTLAFAVGMALLLTGLGAFIYVRVSGDLLASVDRGLSSRAQVLVHSAGQLRSGVSSSSGSLIDADESFAQILDRTGRVLESSGPPVESALVSAQTLAPITVPTSFTRTITSIDTDPVRLFVIPLSPSAGGGFLVVGATLGDRRDALERLFVSLAIGGPVALTVTAAGGWLLAGAALRPVERMRRDADAISVSEPDRRLPVPSTGDELTRLGETLNRMLDRLQESFERERRFVDDASHELRTPLAILKMELDLALLRARTPQELEEALRNASQETDRLARLAEDLLVLARMERGHVPVNRAEVSVQDLLEQVAATYADRARAAGARIELALSPDTASVDPVRVRQAVENLLDNALRHTRPGGVISLHAARDGDTLRITVDDPGPGFPEAVLDRAFEPFVRSEAGAGEDGPRLGLGLAIVQAVADAHEGVATAENPPEGGARVTLLLRG